MNVYPLALPARMSVERLAEQTGVHPQLLVRFVELGLLEAERDSAGRLWLAPDAVVTVARVQRLRMGLSLNYAAIGLVLDLLDRIDELERRERSWT
jgi:DNA-binding transcriptional MerR regulator